MRSRILPLGGKFGVSKKPRNPEAEEFRAPITSTELSKSLGELIEHPGPKVNWRVFVVAAAVILGFSLWAMLAPDAAAPAIRPISSLLHRPLQAAASRPKKRRMN